MSFGGYNVRLVCGRSLVRFPAKTDTKTFADVVNLLTSSVSAELSKDSDSTLLNTRYKAKNNTITFLTNTLYVRTGSWFVPNSCRSFPPE